MKLLLPFHRSYLQVGVLESSHIKYLVQILRELDDATSKEERDAKMQALVVFTRQTLEEHESDVLGSLASSQKLLKQSDGVRKKLLLSNKVGQIQNAVDLTALFRIRYHVPARHDKTDSGQAIKSADVTANSTNATLESAAGIHKLRAERSPAQRKEEKGYVSEKSKQWLEVKQTTAARTQAKNLADTKRKL